ncbi:Ubiquitin system component Cue [Trinorchestia longiramus]|nr:Ubiquitin system component Cue [Trinorchestia longiramus]
MAGAGAQATQLDFHQAMHDFRVMFPDMDANVIEAVLRSNHGAVHATIDQLLTMTTDIEADLMREERLPPALLLQQSVPDVVPTPRQSASLREDSSEDLLTWDGRGGGAEAFHQTTPAIMIGEQPPSYSLFASPPPSYHQAVLPALVSGPPSSPPSLRRSHNWRPPLLLPLPPDFLRLPSTSARAPQVSDGWCVLSSPSLGDGLGMMDSITGDQQHHPITSNCSARVLHNILA